MASSLIKRPNAETEYTSQTIQDLRRCLTDPIFFIEKFVMVHAPTKGKVPMVLYEYQKEMLLGIHNHKETIILASRQLGKCVVGCTSIKTIVRPSGLKKAILKFIDKEQYGELFGQCDQEKAPKGIYPCPTRNTLHKEEAIQKCLKFLKSKIVNWCLQVSTKSAEEIYALSDPKQVNIPAPDGKLKFLKRVFPLFVIDINL